MQTTAAHGEGALRAARIRQRVLVARGHPDPERVRHQMQDALAAHLGGALAAAFAPAALPADDAVWQIRHLRMQLAVTTRWDAMALARAWATQLADTVRRVMAAGGDGVNVMRWPSRATYLASYVREVADGTAASRWWYPSFAGLRLLTRSGQIRSALQRDATLGAAALATLSAPALALVVAQLTAADARSVLDAVSPAGDGSDSASAAAALLSACEEVGMPATRNDEERWALRLVVAAGRKELAAPRTARADLARAWARLATLAAATPARLAVVQRLLAEGRAASLLVVLDSGDAERVAPLAQVGPKALQAFVEHIAQAHAPRAVAVTAEAPVWMPIAAPLLLAPLAAALPLDEAARGWPDCGDESAAALLRLFVLATACGGDRAARVLADPTARCLAGVGPTIGQARLRAWAGALTEAHAAQLEATLRDARLTAGGSAGATWLLAEAEAGDDEGVATMALIDCARGYWLSLRDDGGAADDGLRRWAQDIAAAAPQALLAASESLALWLAPAFAPALRLQAATAAVAPDAPLAATLSRLPRLGDDIAWLALPAALAVPRPLALVLAVAAQGLLRDLAFRIPGFARASLPHLWLNFLAFDAQLERQGARLVARVSRPPLAMVLAMTGLLRSSYRLPWLDEGRLQVELFPADGT